MTRMAVKRVISMHTARSSQTMRSRRSRTETWQDMASIGLVLPTFLQHLTTTSMSHTAEPNALEPNDVKVSKIEIG